MSDKAFIPLVSELKAQARRLRARLAAEGLAISHSNSLERVAALYGRRDWNTLRADAAQLQSSALKPGARLKGRYLSQPFSGEVVGACALTGDHTRLIIRFDAPIDVVTFKSFSAFRTRITATVGPAWRTAQKTSDGTPHLVIDSAA